MEEKRTLVCLSLVRIGLFHPILISRRLRRSFSGCSQGLMHIPGGPER